MSNTKKTTAILLIALALLAGFSGCSGGGGADAPTSIQITIADIEVAKMPHFINSKGMAGFTISLIPETASVTIDYNVPYLTQRTVLNGPAAEAVKPFLSNPPSKDFSLDFNVELSAKFNGIGKYVVVFGASDDYCKYEGQTPASKGPYAKLYPEGKMFITKDSGGTQKGTRDISDGVTIPWSDFLKNADGFGYSAEDIAAMFP